MARARSELIDEPHAPLALTFVLHGFDAAEQLPGAARRFRRREAGADQIVRLGIEVKAHLFIERLDEVLALGQGRQDRA